MRIEDLEAVLSGVSGFIVLDGRRGLVLGDVRVADDGRFEAHRSDGYFAGAFKTLGEAMKTLAGDR